MSNKPRFGLKSNPNPNLGLRDIKSQLKIWKFIDDCVYAINVSSLSAAPLAVRPGVEAFGSSADVTINFDEARLVYGFVVQASAGTTFTVVYHQSIGASSKTLQNFFANTNQMLVKLNSPITAKTLQLLTVYPGVHFTFVEVILCQGIVVQI